MSKKMIFMLFVLVFNCVCFGSDYPNSLQFEFTEIFCPDANEIYSVDIICTEPYLQAGNYPKYWGVDYTTSPYPEIKTTWLDSNIFYPLSSNIDFDYIYDEELPVMFFPWTEPPLQYKKGRIARIYFKAHNEGEFIFFLGRCEDMWGQFNIWKTDNPKQYCKVFVGKYYPQGDINRDTRVDIFDLALLAENWMYNVK